MLTYLQARNFKSLMDTEIRFSDFTVLFGDNASGKSNILQAIDFLLQSADKDFSHILEQRGYFVEDMISKWTPTQDRSIYLASEWALPADTGQFSLRWEMELACSVQDNSMRLLHETIRDLNTGQNLLVYTKASSTRPLVVYGSDGTERIYPPITLQSSALKIAVNLESKAEAQILQKLASFKRFLTASCSYDMLSPSEMRQSSRGTVKNIGRSGRDLPSYIQSLSSEAIDDFQESLRRLMGDTLTSVHARTERDGWVRIEAIETYGGKTVEISSQDMSDGMLRLLAILSMSAMAPIPKYGDSENYVNQEST